MGETLISLKQLLLESWLLYRIKWLGVVKLIIKYLLLYIPVGAFSITLAITLALLKRPDLQVGLDLLQWLGFGLIFILFIIGIAVINITQTISLIIFLANPDKEADFKELFQISLKKVIDFVALGWLKGFIVLGGLLLLIAPGILFYFWYIFAGYILIFENMKPGDALNSSRAIVQEKFWGIVGRLIFLMVLNLVALIVINLLPHLINSLSGSVNLSAFDLMKVMLDRGEKTTDFGLFIYNNLVTRSLDWFLISPFFLINSILLYKSARNLYNKPLPPQDNRLLIRPLILPLLLLLLAVCGILVVFFLVAFDPLKRILSEKPELVKTTNLSPIITEPPTVTPTPLEQKNYWDRECHFTMEYDGEYREEIIDGQKLRIFSYLDYPGEQIIIGCAKQMPRPDIPPEMTSEIVIDRQTGTLYRDVLQEDGSKKDLIIIKHGDKDIEFSITGAGKVLFEKIENFVFVWG